MMTKAERTSLALLLMTLGFLAAVAMFNTNLALHLGIASLNTELAMPFFYAAGFNFLSVVGIGIAVSSFSLVATRVTLEPALAAEKGAWAKLHRFALSIAPHQPSPLQFTLLCLAVLFAAATPIGGVYVALILTLSPALGRYFGMFLVLIGNAAKNAFWAKVVFMLKIGSRWELALFMWLALVAVLVHLWRWQKRTAASVEPA